MSTLSAEDMRVAKRVHWTAIAVCAVPALLFSVGFFADGSVELKDGKYACEPAIPLGGMFWNGKVVDDQLVAMRWTGLGRRSVEEFDLVSRDGSEEFSAIVDGRSVVCRYRT